MLHIYTHNDETEAEVLLLQVRRERVTSGTGSFGSSFNSPAQSEGDSNYNLLINITQNTHTFKDESYRAEGAFTVFLCSDDWKFPFHICESHLMKQDWLLNYR